jgi:hypothetical protein
MKKSTVKLFGILTLTAGLISCSSSDNPTPTATPSSTFTADAHFQGDINEGEVTLDPTKRIN